MNIVLMYKNKKSVKNLKEELIKKNIEVIEIKKNNIDEIMLKNILNDVSMDIIIIMGECIQHMKETFFNMLYIYPKNIIEKELYIVYNDKIIYITQKQEKEIILKYCKLKEMCNNIISTINDNNQIIEKIKIELKKINFNFLHIGTNYLVKSIYEVYLNSEKENINLSKDIFPSVAKKMNKKANTIHSGIKKEILNMYYDCEEEKLKKYFNFFNFEERPKLKEIIFEIIRKI